ncbi:helix-turn-helix domain-containing protein [Gynuella sp.]|uniref:helix-turn-helix domain-containing protein n=1 Tax=Gynuella sp. TaxID=2969146 RepID=UPI003D0D10A0
MHPAHIKALLEIEGFTASSIADELDVHRTAVSKVIYGNSVSKRIQNRIAEITGKTVSELWPEKRRRIRRTADEIRSAV